MTTVQPVMTKPDMLRVTVAEGKYTLVQDGEGRQFALRYGEPWRDLVGDNLTLALGYALEEAQTSLATALDALKQRTAERDEARRERDRALAAAEEACKMAEALFAKLEGGEAMTLTDFNPGDRVAHVEFDGSKEWGTVSSIGRVNVFVRFDEQVAKLGWDGATSQACDPRDLVKEAVV